MMIERIQAPLSPQSLSKSGSKLISEKNSVIEAADAVIFDSKKEGEKGVPDDAEENLEERNAPDQERFPSTNSTAGKKGSLSVVA